MSKMSPSQKREGSSQNRTASAAGIGPRVGKAILSSQLRKMEPVAAYLRITITSDDIVFSYSI